MSQVSEFKEVYFHEYCKKCKHKDLGEDDQPCRECLCEAVNIDSHKPVRYENGPAKRKKAVVKDQ